MEKVRFSENLKILLEDSELSFSQLCQKVCLNKNSLRAYMNGRVPRSWWTLIRLSCFFNVSMESLIFGKNIKPKPLLWVSCGRIWELKIKEVNSDQFNFGTQGGGKKL